MPIELESKKRHLDTDQTEILAGPIFHRLNKDVVSYLFSFFSKPALGRLAQTSKNMNLLVTQNQTYLQNQAAWKYKLEVEKLKNKHADVLEMIDPIIDSYQDRFGILEEAGERENIRMFFLTLHMLLNTFNVGISKIELSAPYSQDAPTDVKTYIHIRGDNDLLRILLKKFFDLKIYDHEISIMGTYQKIFNPDTRQIVDLILRAGIPAVINGPTKLNPKTDRALIEKHLVAWLLTASGHKMTLDGTSSFQQVFKKIKMSNLQNIKELLPKERYKDNMDRKDAEKYLIENPNRRFIFRMGSTGDAVVSFIKINQVYHRTVNANAHLLEFMRENSQSPTQHHRLT